MKRARRPTVFAAALAICAALLPISAAAAAQPQILAPPDQIVGESDGFVDLPVHLSVPGESTVTVKYETASITAGSGLCSGGDYTSASGTLTFSPGETTKVVRVDIDDCLDVDGLKSLFLKLNTPTNATIAREKGWVGILDDDTPAATPKLFVRDATVDEKDGLALVSVLLGGAHGESSNSTVTVNYATADVTATAPSDYTAASGTLTFAPGETAKTIAVPIDDDTDAEPAESFQVLLSSPTNATISDSAGVVRIGASDAAPSSQPQILAPPDQIVGESDGFVDLPVHLSVPGESTVTVKYETASITAGSGLCSGGDYTSASGTLTFSPGETTKVVRVDIDDCLDVDGLKSLFLKLNTPTNATIAREKGWVGILDDDTPAATPKLFVRDATVDEKDGLALVSVLLGGAHGESSNSTVTVNYATADVTATAPSDYTAASGTLTFAPGETAKTIAVPIDDDTDAEPAESFQVLLSSPTNATISDSAGVVRIGASDAAPSSQPQILAPPDQIVGESDGFVDLPVHLSVPGESTVTVKYETASITAGSGLCSGGDYTSASGTLTFSPGETTKVVRVDIDDCLDVDGLKSLFLKLNTPTNATIAREKGWVGILDDDTPAATPKLFVRDATVDEKDGLALVSVLLGGAHGESSNSTVTVNYATADVTATAPSDYTAASGTLTFAPGETAKTIAVPIDDDTDAEPAESFQVLLSSPTNATISDSAGVVRIGASDAAPSSQPQILAPPDQIVGESDGFVDLPVHLSVPGESTVTVKYETASITAGSGLCSGGDYTSASGTLTFSPGETTKVVRVDIDDCLDVDGLKSLFLKLNTPTNATIAREKGWVGILDDDTPAATPKLFVRDATVDEKDGLALVSVLLGGAHGESSNSTVTVNYATADVTATAPSDYTAASGTLTFAPGETAKTIAVPIDDDTDAEPAESFQVLLSSPTNATISDSAGVVRIGASDAAPSSQPQILAPPDQIVGESDGFVDLPVHLSVPGESTVTVKYETASITAGSGLCSGGDYTSASGTLTFSPGETTKVVRVDIDDCGNVEGIESFLLKLNSATNGTIIRTSGTVSIIDSSVSLMGVSVTPISPSVAVGADRQLTATASFSDSSTIDATSSVSWASSQSAVATVDGSGLAHGVGVGQSTITATLWTMSGSTELTVAGGPQAQTISFPGLPDRTFGDPDFSLSASASSALPVSFAATGSCTVSGASVHLTGAGSCTITASQAGNASFSPAPSVQRSFAVAKASQTISFPGLPDRTFGDPDFSLSASASSALPVSFAATGSCTVSGASVHLTGAGSCTITASQAGNANFEPAASTQQSLSIHSPPKPPVNPPATTTERACIAKAKVAFRQASKAARRLRGRRAREKALGKARRQRAKQVSACKKAG